MSCPITTGTSFHSFFLIPFLICSIIATIHVYKISKRCAQPFLSYGAFGRNELTNYYRYEFSLVFLNYFFILLYSSYDTRLQNFEKLRPPVPKLLYYGRK